jgi:acetyl esterase/lipase
MILSLQSRMAMGLLLLLVTAIGRAAGQSPVIVLWPGGAPGSEGRGAEAETVRVNERAERIVSNVHAPSITVFLPATAHASRTAVIVVPGGGHTELWMDHEGYRVAGFLADHGIAGFVLKYRLAREKGSTYTVEGTELGDLQRAIRLVRSRSAQWRLDPQHIGVLGFSAGGELAALSATRFDDGAADATDPVERLSSRPDFQALLYPAIPQDMKISPQTPPAFLLCGADDQPATSQGLAELYVALRRAGVPAEIHIYDGVGHGFGMRAGDSGAVAQWPQRFLDWLDQQGLARHQ